MTEKRFTIKPQDNYFGITDNNTADKMNVINGIRTEIEAKWLCDLMNELNEEKEILKVQLKSATNEINKIMSEINTLTDTCHDCCKEIREENEQLKCGNKNLKAILNDFINICNRLQSNPNDKQTLNVARDMLQNMGKEIME